MQNDAFVAKLAGLWTLLSMLKWDQDDRTAGHSFPSSLADRHAYWKHTASCNQVSHLPAECWAPDRKKDWVCVNICVRNREGIKETMRRTTAASGLDGWGTQHNTTVLSLIQNTDTEQQPTLIDSTCCVCYERDRMSERRTDRELRGGLKRERWGWGRGTVLTRYCLRR